MRRMIKYHPTVIILFFICSIFYTMYTNNPLIISLSLLGSFLFYFTIEEKKIFFKYSLFAILIFIVITITNPLFVSKGNTILFMIGKKVITKESLIYGAMMSMMLIAIITWFSCYNKIMTMDKFVYLFGKATPNISTAISMGIAFIPRFIEKGKAINLAQKNLGLYKQNLLPRMKLNLRVFSSLITWALENSIDTADSMNARGYGSKNKTKFSVFKYNTSDFLLTIVVIVLIIFIVIGSAFQYLDYQYYPTLTTLNFSTINILLYSSFGLLMLIPTIIEVKENVKWNFFKSKI